ncbi:fibronectin type III domain-containing protein [Propionibacteriaceae bacterium Y1700]|uniref:fibronectin type III domain-containing protein n=1 Tax=Microlunatus sp. Y1700 TaxID=3418487 RepID=UPI003DA6DA34
MRAKTIRQLTVVAVACVGVVALYLVPIDASGPLSARQELATEPPPSPASSNASSQDGTSTPQSPSAPRTPAKSYDPDEQVSTSTPSAIPTGGTPSTPGRSVSSQSPSSSASRTPSNPPSSSSPTPSPDTTPPSAPSDLEVVKSDAQTVTLRWAPSEDADRVAGYNVYVNRFNALQTTSTLAQVKWFRDDTTPRHVFTVRAVDAAGNEGPPSDPVTEVSPTPDPSPTSPSPSDDSPSPSEEPSHSPDGPPSPTESDGQRGASPEPTGMPS